MAMMWSLKNDVNEGDLVPIAQLQSPKEHREEELAKPWSFEALSEDQLRWYWIKQPFSLQGTSIDLVPLCRMLAMNILITQGLVHESTRSFASDDSLACERLIACCSNILTGHPAPCLPAALCGGRQ